MRVLGVDFGFARIGIATGETEFRITSSKGILKASKSLAKDAATLVSLAKKEGCEQIIVGLPILENAHDDGRMQRICRSLAKNISLLSMPVILVDESFTSVAAESKLYDLGYKQTKVKKLKDCLSAELILERFFEIGSPSA